jgi:anti-sigma B factor antagonist
MALKLDVIEVGDVTILRVDGRIVLGDESRSLRNMVRKLLDSGGKKIILNVDNVTFIDSAGNGEVVALNHSARVRGADVKLCHVHGKLQEVWQISKLFTVFDVFSTEVDALRSFESPSWYCICPACGQQCGPFLLSARLQTQTCKTAVCGARFTIGFSQAVGDSAPITRLTFQTYENESLEIEAGTPLKCQIFGRLDRFSSSALEKSWLALPLPRRVVFDLRHITETSDAGRTALSALLERNEHDSKATASLEGLNAEQLASFSYGAPFYRQMADALRALGDVSDTPRWLTRIILVESPGQRRSVRKR